MFPHSTPRNADPDNADSEDESLLSSEEESDSLSSFDNSFVEKDDAYLDERAKKDPESSPKRSIDEDSDYVHEEKEDDDDDGDEAVHASESSRSDRGAAQVQPRDVPECDLDVHTKMVMRRFDSVEKVLSDIGDGPSFDAIKGCVESLDTQSTGLTACEPAVHTSASVRMNGFSKLVACVDDCDNASLPVQAASLLSVMHYFLREDLVPYEIANSMLDERAAPEKQRQHEIIMSLLQNILEQSGESILARHVSDINSTNYFLSHWVKRTHKRIESLALPSS